MGKSVVGERILVALGLQRMSHRPRFGWRFWVYAGAAYLIPVVVCLALPPEPGSVDELVWLVTLVPAFLLALHFGLRGAFVALLVGTALFVAVQLVLVFGRGPDDPRITVPIYIAYGALAISVGWLSEQLHEHYEYALELLAAQKTEALGTLAAGIAHDFNNVLTAVVANAELITDRVGSAAEGDETQLTAAREELDQLKWAAYQGAGMVRNLLGFSRRGMLVVRPLDLPELLAGEERARLERLLPRAIGLRVDVEEAVPRVVADEEAVKQILVNLVTNARDAMSGAGDIVLRLGPARLDPEYRRRKGWGDPGDYVRLQVVDPGTGMDSDTLESIFEPFFTGKEPGEGIGLGMAMVYGLMKQHRGFVDVESVPGEGTSVSLYFPVAKDRTDVPRASAGDRPQRGTETILLVEDEEPVRRAARRILERAGYTVHVAADGEEALELFRTHRRELDLILTDVVLPKLTGPEIYERIRWVPGAPRFLFMSGYPARTVQSTASLDPGAPFLQKPWTVEELTGAVRAALDEPVGPRDGSTRLAGESARV